LRLSRVAIFRICGTAAFLVLLLVAQRPCADAVANLVTRFNSPRPATDPSATSAPVTSSPAVPPPAAGSAIDLRNAQHLRPDMTDAETKAAIDRARGTPSSGPAKPAGTSGTPRTTD
jgi:hypothetical protein